MRRLWIAALLLLLIGGALLWWLRAHPSQTAPTAAASEVIPDFSLADTDDRGFFLSRNKDVRLVVLIAHSVGCPILQHSISSLNELHDKYSGKGVRFAFVNAVDKPDEIRKEATSYGVKARILLDPSQMVSQTLGFSRSATAIAIDTTDFHVVYRGAIDDRLDYGAQKKAPAHTWLVDAIEATLAGKPVTVSKTEAKGCIINFEKPRPVSWTSDVVPVLARSCVACHERNDVTPLNTGHLVRRLAPMVRETTLTHRMPPYGPDPQYGNLSTSPVLTAEEARMLVSWVDQGAPCDGDEEAVIEAAEPPHNRTTFAHIRPDIRWKMPSNVEIPATGLIRYRYFQVYGPAPEDMWIEALRIAPSNRRVVHHAAVLVLPKPLAEYGDELSADSMTKMDDWHNDVIEPLYFLTPGRARVHPVVPGTSWFVRKGSCLAVQMHYGSTGKPEVDRSSVQLWLSRAPNPVRLRTAYVQSKRFVVPAHARDFIVRAEKVFDESVAILHMAPHLHYRGAGIRFLAELPDGSRRVLLSMPFYNFNWQRGCLLDEPVVLPAGSKVIVEGMFDNSSSNPLNPDPEHDVPWGRFTEINEMFKGSITYVKAVELEHLKENQAGPKQDANPET